MRTLALGEHGLESVFDGSVALLGVAACYGAGVVFGVDELFHDSRDFGKVVAPNFFDKGRVVCQSVTRDVTLIYRWPWFAENTVVSCDWLNACSTSVGSYVY